MKKVILIGDSIRMAYQPFVTQAIHLGSAHCRLGNQTRELGLHHRDPELLL